VILLPTARETTAVLPLLRVILLLTAWVTTAAPNHQLLHLTVTRSVTTLKFSDITVVKVERVERVDIMEDIVDSDMVEKVERDPRVDTTAVVLTTSPKNVKSSVTKFTTHHKLALTHHKFTLDHMIITNMIT